MKESSGNKLIANNKKAYYDYFIDEKYEAGLVLHGTEVKSLRQGKCSIKEAYIQIINGEVFVINMNITPYEKGNIFNKDPLRPKKLLLHQSEINKLEGQGSLSLPVPLTEAAFLALTSAFVYNFVSSSSSSRPGVLRLNFLIRKLKMK